MCSNKELPHTNTHTPTHAPTCAHTPSRIRTRTRTHTQTHPHPRTHKHTTNHTHTHTQSIRNYILPVLWCWTRCFFFHQNIKNKDCSPYPSTAGTAAVRWWRRPVCRWAMVRRTPPCERDWPQTLCCWSRWQTQEKSWNQYSSIQLPKQTLIKSH